MEEQLSPDCIHASNRKQGGIAENAWAKWFEMNKAMQWQKKNKLLGKSANPGMGLEINKGNTAGCQKPIEN